jgi:hypothetical protein
MNAVAPARIIRFLPRHFIRNYLFKIFDKLGVSTRVELVLYCLQERQSSDPDPDD